jgi:nitroreductase
MSTPVTYEVILDTIQRIALQQEATDRLVQETAEQMKRTDKKISDLGDRIGEIVENMVGSNIVGQFQALNIAIKSHSRNKTFGIKGTEASGEIDVFLENGDVVVLIEVKTRLTEDGVRVQLDRLEKYRLYGDDKRRILGAVTGAVVADDVVKFAHRQGLYVIVQSGEAVKIIAPPEGFVAKEW